MKARWVVVTVLAALAGVAVAVLKPQRRPEVCPDCGHHSGFHSEQHGCELCDCLLEWR